MGDFIKKNKEKIYIAIIIVVFIWATLYMKTNQFALSIIVGGIFAIFGSITNILITAGYVARYGIDFKNLTEDEREKILLLTCFTMGFFFCLVGALK